MRGVKVCVSVCVLRVKKEPIRGVKVCARGSFNNTFNTFVRSFNTFVQLRSFVRSFTDRVLDCDLRLGLFSKEPSPHHLLQRHYSVVQDHRGLPLGAQSLDLVVHRIDPARHERGQLTCSFVRSFVRSLCFNRMYRLFVS